MNLGAHPIGVYFGAHAGSLPRVADSYNLSYAVLPFTGALLADLYGRRRVFISAAVTFTLSSVLCAAAPAITIPIGARAFRGFGAAPLLPASLAIIRIVWPDPEAAALRHMRADVAKYCD